MPEFDMENPEVEDFLDEEDREFVDRLIDKLLLICNELLPEEESLRPYQIPFARRIFESMITNDGNLITALFSRQSGKSETLALVTATAMIMFPKLALVYPSWLRKFRHGVRVGAFAPVDEQADNLFGRITERMTSHQAITLMADPDIGDYPTSRGRTLYLQNGSLVRKTTCHPKATIEGRTYELILIDECQGADKLVVDKKIGPMGASTNATMVFTGTPDFNKGIFYETIRVNKRLATARKTNNFEVDWKTVAKYNPDYAEYIKGQKVRIGEDSDEFKLSYRIIWILEKGMFTTSERLEELGDSSMQETVKAYHGSPVVAGIDCGRKQDKTIVTVVFVDWDNPDPFGFHHHHVLDWLDLEGVDWEEQYFRIVEFLQNYSIWKVGIDVGGLGDVVAQRLKVLMPGVDIVELGSANSEQSIRWKHLKSLLDNKQISWPAGAKVRRLRKFKRFYQEMEDLEIQYKAAYVLGQAPSSANAHDDYPDSLSMACILSALEDTGQAEEVEVYSNIFYRSNRRAR